MSMELLGLAITQDFLTNHRPRRWSSVAAIVAVVAGLLVLLGLAAPGFAASMMAMCGM
jgi:uncharacterized membrane protein YphA (DoxX/SURF4 family)